MNIPFMLPSITQASLDYVRECVGTRQMQGDGVFTRKATTFLKEQSGSPYALLTSSCTDALEMCALLLDLQPGDEVIMPSYTFPSTATAFALRGGVPVFVDIRPDTINIDENAIEAAITPKTKAIVIVHYGGVSCAMEPIMALAQKHNVKVIEDAAHAYGASYKGKALGTIGHMGTYSFHNSKNISAGEGGAILLQDETLFHRAEIMREKGTNRSSFMRGDAAFYAWQDLGSSYLMSDLTAAFLLGQLEAGPEINKRRSAVWDVYHEMLEPLEKMGLLRRPVLPEGCDHNAHLYYILLPDAAAKTKLANTARENQIGIIPHYVPLHSAPAGLKYGRVNVKMTHTDDIAGRLLRLPLYADLPRDMQENVIAFVKDTLG